VDEGVPLSVVVPAFNAERTIAATIRSVLGQTRADFELIVVDDGSSDRTPEIAGRFAEDPRVRLVRQQNAGPAAARNRGIDEAGGEYVSFLDHDDLWMPEYLERMAAALDGVPEAGFAYADGWVVDDESGRVRRGTALEIAGAPAERPADPTEFLAALLHRTFIRSATTIRSDALAEAGGFDPALDGVDDFDLWSRILLRGRRAVQAPGMLVIFRAHSESLSRDALRMCVARREVVRRLAEDYGAPAEISAAAAAQVPDHDRYAAALTGEARVRAALLRGRLLLGRAHRAVLGGRRFRSSAPPEVATTLARLEGP
jgi:glycosyltransferase involved in cell wall biosynthesis